MGAAAAQLGRRRREDLADGVVELADRGEAGRERDLGERQLGRLDQQSRGVGALGAGERERAGAELGDELAVQVAFAEAEPLREPGDAVAVDAAVGDQPHRAADDVGAHVPLRRTRRGVRPAALAGAEAGALRRGRGRQEAHVGALRRDGRAARAAVDPGRRDGGHEPAVEAAVLGADGAVALFEVLDHGFHDGDPPRARLVVFGRERQSACPTPHARPVPERAASQNARGGGRSAAPSDPAACECGARSCRPQRRARFARSSQRSASFALRPPATSVYAPFVSFLLRLQRQRALVRDAALGDRAAVADETGVSRRALASATLQRTALEPTSLHVTLASRPSLPSLPLAPFVPFAPLVPAGPPCRPCRSGR